MTPRLLHTLLLGPILALPWLLLACDESGSSRPENTADAEVSTPSDSNGLVAPDGFISDTSSLVPVRVDPLLLQPATSNTGYRVVLEQARITLVDLELEAPLPDESAGATTPRIPRLRPTPWQQALAWLGPSTAWAHPGEAHGNDPDYIVIAWFPGAHPADLAVASELGGMDLPVSPAVERAGLYLGLDPITGASIDLRARATTSAQSEASWQIEARFVLEDRTRVSAIVTNIDNVAGEESVDIHLLSVDPNGFTLFDNVEVEALDADGDGLIVLDPEDAATAAAHGQLRANLTSPRFWRVD